MRRSTRTGRRRGATITLRLAGAMLTGTACHGEYTAEPTDPSVGDRQPELATTTTIAALTFRQLSAGGTHTCGVTLENKAYCWGRTHETGAIGDGALEDRLAPAAVAGTLQWRSVSAGYAFSCGVTTDNVAYCWGNNSVGQLGNGTTRDRLTPARVAGDLQFRNLDVGSFNACGLTTLNRLYCWGWNLGGEVGDGTMTTRLRPVAVLTERRFRQVSVGAGHSCAVSTAFKAFCWGSNERGKLGHGLKGKIRLRPAAVAGDLLFSQISAGLVSTCAVTTDSRVYCWGRGSEAEIGDGKLLDRWTPRAVVGGLSVSRVSTGYHSCAETTDDRVFCWGPNFVGQLGNVFANGLKPAAVAGGLLFRQVSAGDQHTCGVSSSNLAYCWGDSGTIGDGTNEVRREPVPVAGPM